MHSMNFIPRLQIFITLACVIDSRTLDTAVHKFTLNVLTSCDLGTQLRWGYRAIQYLNEVFVADKMKKWINSNICLIFWIESKLYFQTIKREKLLYGRWNYYSKWIAKNVFLVFIKKCNKRAYLHNKKGFIYTICLRFQNTTAFIFK